MKTTQAHRNIELRTPLGKDALLFQRLAGSERLGAPFEFDVAVLSEAGTIDGDALLGNPVALVVKTKSGAVSRCLHGIVAEFAQTGYGERHHEYQLVLRPWFWLLTRTADCRIFQNKSVVEIFEAVVKEYGFSDYKVGKLRGSYPKLEFCVQYRETDFNFLSRLLEQEGIYYFFEHTESAHTLVLADDATAHVAASGYAEVPYFPPDRAETQRARDYLDAWSFSCSVQPGVYATTDYDFEKPGGASALLGRSSIERKHARASFEIFDFPAELPPAPGSADSERIARLRIQELQAAYRVARGHGTAIGLGAGLRFKLTGYPRADLNVEYLVVASRYSLASNPYETGSEDDDEISISVEAIDVRTPFRAPRVTPKPVVQGAQTATVVGPAGEEIHTDKYGRVKVQFHWDRYGKRDENSSCWIRVAQVWAGNQWGAMHVPRIGQEVIVSFLEGDPDRPIVTGRVYNGSQMPPYALPANATQSGIKSRSSKGGGTANCNEIRFEDKKGSEELYLQAEKDLTSLVKNDESATVENDRRRKVKNNETVDIGKKFHLKVGDEITIETGQSKIVMKKNGDVTITCKNLEVKASSGIVLKAAKSVEVNGQSKVQVKSLDVKVDGQTSVAVSSGVNMKVAGKMTKVEGAMLDLSGSGLAKLKGGVTMIG